MILTDVEHALVRRITDRSVVIRLTKLRCIRKLKDGVPLEGKTAVLIDDDASGLNGVAIAGRHILREILHRPARIRALEDLDTGVGLEVTVRADGNVDVLPWLIGTAGDRQRSLGRIPTSAGAAGQRHDKGNGDQTQGDSGRASPTRPGRLTRHSHSPPFRISSSPTGRTGAARESRPT